jgi:hypothetical protein
MQRMVVDLPEPDGPHSTIALAHVEVDVLEHVELAVPLVHAGHANDAFSAGGLLDGVAHVLS